MNYANNLLQDALVQLFKEINSVEKLKNKTVVNQEQSQFNANGIKQMVFAKIANFHVPLYKGNVTQQNIVNQQVTYAQLNLKKLYVLLHHINVLTMVLINKIIYMGFYGQQSIRL